VTGSHAAHFDVLVIKDTRKCAEVYAGGETEFIGIQHGGPIFCSFYRHD
jgi:hypothetical protein